MIIYISGKISGRPKEEYMKQFADAEKKLTEQGYTVINPARVNAEMPESTSYNGYMSMSKTMLEQADCIYLMSGWELSNGANLEFQWALNKGMMIMFEDAKYIKKVIGLMNAAEQNFCKCAYSIGD